MIAVFIIRGETKKIPIYQVTVRVAEGILPYDGHWPFAGEVSLLHAGEPLNIEPRAYFIPGDYYA